jgi:hypothetical protein
MATNRKRRTRTPRQVMPEWAENPAENRQKTVKNDGAW